MWSVLLVVLWMSFCCLFVFCCGFCFLLVIFAGGFCLGFLLFGAGVLIVFGWFFFEVLCVLSDVFLLLDGSRLIGGCFLPSVF